MTRGAFTRRTALWSAALVLAAVVTAVLGYLELMTSIALSDDEGYALVTVSEYLHRGGLYDLVYSQYGPFYAQFWAAVTGGLGISLTNSAARGLVLVGWIVTSALTGIATWRLVRSPALGVLTQLLVFTALTPLAIEPLHPGGLICLLLAAIFTVTVMTVRTRPLLAAKLLGGLVAALVLVKINIGGLAVIAALLAAGLTLPGLANRRSVRWLASGLALGAPAGLMQKDLGHDWARRYAILVTAAVAAVVVSAWPRATSDRPVDDRTGPRFVLAGGATFAAVAGAICLVAILTGTSPNGLVHGTLIEPLGQSDAFQVQLALPRRSIAIVLLGLGAAVLVRRLPSFSDTARTALSLGGGAFILWSIADPGVLATFPSETPVFAGGLAFAWVAVLASARPTDPLERFVVVFLTSLAVLQTLHAYPVAGSQRGFGAFLLVPVGVICLANGSLPALRGRVAVVSALLVTILFGRVAIGEVLEPLRSASAHYEHRVPFGLPGTAGIRLVPQRREPYRQLAIAIERSCSDFITVPGMNSLYIYTRRRPPTGYNATAWMYLFDEQTQRRVVARIRNRRGLCIVRNDTVLAFWARGRQIPDRPLYHFLTHGVKRIGTYSGFALQVKKH